MAQYFFHVKDRRGELRDEEGQDLPDLASVRVAAMEGARSLICADVTEGVLDLNGTITVTDASGELVLMLPYDQAVSSDGPDAT